LISILIPCYNCVTTLERAVHSAIEQPGVDVQVILVNDASTDHTREVMESLARRYPQVDCVQRKVNGRIAAALNTGAEYATGDYIMRLDSDDWLEPGSLLRMRVALDANPDVTFVYGGRRYYGRRSDTYMPRPFNADAFNEHNASGYAYMFRRSVLDNGITWEALGEFGGVTIDLEDWQHVHKMLSAGYRGMALTDTLVLHYVFRSTGTWAELKAVEPEALATLKAKYPSIRAVSL
jgi:glycosyltransferase involved in cell wall biosynthesis